MEKSDEELLENARSGSRPAWAELYERHQRGIYRFALHMSGSPLIADEVVQETFFDLLRGGLRFDPAKGSLGAFLLGVARIKSLRLGRGHRAEQSADRIETVASEADVAGSLENRQRDQTLHQAILGLPEHYREAVVLCELTGLSYEEAAGVIGCPVGTVRSRLHRARHLLLERLAEKGIHGVHLNLRENARMGGGGAAMPEEARAHLNSCANCLEIWGRQRELTAALTGLLAQARDSSASLAVKTAVVGALPSRLPTGRRAWTPLLALAAALMLAVAGGWYLQPMVRQVAQPPSRGMYTDFFPLSTVTLDRQESSQLVRIRLPRREMRRFGLPVSEELERSSIEAEVLIGQDGIARAVRFVSLSQ